MIQGNKVECILYPITPIGDVSIVLKPDTMVPGVQNNNVWYGNITKENATGDLLKLIELKEKLDVTGDPDERLDIAEEMLDLHEANMWCIAYVSGAPACHAVNGRIHNFLEDGVWSDIYRDLGLAHTQCWFIPKDQQ